LKLGFFLSQDKTVSLPRLVLNFGKQNCLKRQINCKI
jgi:hypothetical protein